MQTNMAQVKTIVEKSPKFAEIYKVAWRWEGKISIYKIYHSYIRNIDPKLEYWQFKYWYAKYVRGKSNWKPKDFKTRVITRETDKRAKKDPKFFARHYLGIDLLEWQERWIKRSCHNKRNILVPGNQSGKTFVTAVKHIYLNYFRYGIHANVKGRDRIPYQTLDLSPILKQSRLCYQYILQILTDTQCWTDPHSGRMIVNKCIIKDFLVKPKAVPSTGALANSPIEFKNGTKFWCASTGNDQGAGLQGSQFSFISYDECPLSHHLKEELPGRIMSRLIAMNGSLDLIGTPDSESPSRLYYAQLVKAGIAHKDGWYCQRGKLDDNLFIPEESRTRIKQEILAVNPTIYRQVVYGDFVMSTTKVFPPRVIQRLFEGELQPQLPIPGHSYIIGVDWALAGDYTVMVVIDKNSVPYRIVHFLRYQGCEKPPMDQYSDLTVLKSLYNDADIIMDSSSLGGHIIETDLVDLDVEGYNFAGGRKKPLIQTLKKFLHSREKLLCSYYIPELEEELSVFEPSDEKLQNDSVMALALALWRLDQDLFETPALSFNLEM